jgi:HPr kinase/phosphorylase
MIQISQHLSLHGVMVCVDGLGLLIKGSPGLGKSSLALQLISEGHQLVADDVIDISRHNHELIVTAPSMLKDLLNTRELGTINVKQHFGSAHVLDACPLHYQINLHEKLKLESQLEGNQSNEMILDIRVPTLQLSLSNPSSVTVRLHTWLNMQRMTNNNANKQLKYRQQQQIQQ